MSRWRIFGVAALAAITVVVAPARTVDRAVGVQLRASSLTYARALAIQADGKLVAVGSSDAAGHGGFALARYRRNGSLDGSFGRGGKVLTNFGSSQGAAAVVIQPDGKIVAAGFGSRSADRRDKEFALARYRRKGSLDASFGSGGKVLTSFGRFSGAVGVVLQRDGKLVAVGSSGSNSYAEGQLALARYTRSGGLDASFGRGGKVLMSCGDGCAATAVAIQPDEKIVVAFENSWALARFNTDGTLDRTFGRGGKVSARLRPYALAVQDDGQIVAAGSETVVHGDSENEDFALARYTADGSLDPGFGNGGTVSTDFPGCCSDDGALAVAIQADGKSVAAGYSNANGYDPLGGSDDVVALARYSADGSLDTSFGRRGRVLTRFDSNKWQSDAREVVVQPDAKIAVAGLRFSTETHSRDFRLVRYTARGRLDGSFGRGGKVATDFGTG